MKHFVLLLFFLLISCEGRVNLTCSKSSDCSANASCEEKHCFCNKGYIDEVTDVLRCLKEATKYKDNCEKDIQCNGLLGLRSHCSRDHPADLLGICVCNRDSHYKEGICHKNSYLGDKCIVSSDCIINTWESQAYCSEGKCICSPKHVPSEDKKNCLPIAGLGERCESNITCIVPNSKCAVYCQCEMGYVPSKDSLRCLKAADSLNDPCIEDDQCNEFLKLSRCDITMGKCACQNFTHRLRDQCWLTVDMLGLCEHDSECFVPGDRSGVICKEGSCDCKDGYQMIGSACIVMGQAGFALDTNSSRSTFSYLYNFGVVIIVILVLNMKLK